MSDIFHVVLSRNAYKDIKKIPNYLLLKLYAWIEEVGCNGLSKVKMIKGYHDEALMGKRIGQHSIRLNAAYRAIYVIKKSEVKFIEIIEVNKHDY